MKECSYRLSTAHKSFTAHRSTVRCQPEMKATLMPPLQMWTQDNTLLLFVNELFLILYNEILFSSIGCLPLPSLQSAETLNSKLISVKARKAPRKKLFRCKTLKDIVIYIECSRKIDSRYSSPQGQKIYSHFDYNSFSFYHKLYPTEVYTVTETRNLEMIVRERREEYTK